MLRACQDVLRREPNNFGALCRAAQAHWMLGTPARGLPGLERAIAARPDHADAQHLRACLLQALGQVDAAIAAYGQAVALRPDNVDALANLGGLLCERRRYPEAHAIYARALALRPVFPQALNNLGVALLGMDRVAEAIDAFDRAVAQMPGFADAHANRGSALLTAGDLAGAEQAFETAIRLAPRNGGFYLDLTRSRRFTEADPSLAAMERLADEADLHADSRMKLHFALGKAYADFAAVAPAFAHYQRGNALKRASLAYHEADTLHAMDEIASLFPRERFASPPKGVPDADGFAPIFVVGMPRSGTTLVEQVLASHGQVFGAGERPDLHDAALRQVAPAPAAALFQRLAALPEARLQDLGAQYERALRQAVPGDAPAVARIVDKMPGNFLYLGLIALALPRARVIHVRRDPLDSCLSCYFTLFSGDQPYSYDLGELGRYYRAYGALMRHWHAVLPPGLVLDIGYEDLVADLEGQTRRMLAHCGLGWDPACLDFHRTARAVRTASRAQVRQPLNARSVGRAAAYAPFLAPLRAALAAPSL